MPGSNVFREAIVPEPEPVPSPPQKQRPSDELEGFETPLQTPEGPEDRNLEIWEGLHRRKYVEDYFNVREISSEFMVKMPIAEINKYMVAELQSRDMAVTIDNYKTVLAEIEQEIGSDKLELFKRFHKLTGYIRAVNRLNKAKELKEKYLVE